VVPGLGRVAESYVILADNTTCTSAAYKILAYSARFSVEGKGDLLLSLAETPECIPELAVPRASQAFTVTGGTGIFVGASGSEPSPASRATPVRVLPERTHGTGTVSVPGVEFVTAVDSTAPTIQGARSKVVRAPPGATRVRVTHRVTATDDVDGTVAVSCRPGSGSRFKIGRTVVTRTAADRSNNVATARFLITVKRSR
jgi:hypothetical protein